ncbi:UNKNOWN [Stylonychia lemnae]|uniref:Transmembrane protein n=1 Tax=Stylonychia lemnae TaxID=5949 RepID=A0A078A232_STYLE|nr:UNKNOWN [Stylonychia lemnae]|eukprot:CDW75877.1 UNKNOWN [Stylonychia lemnae]
MTQSQFIGNVAQTGGALYAVSNSNISISYCRFEQNQATKSAGAIYVSTQSIIKIIGSSFQENKAEENSALEILNTFIKENVTITNCDFQDNYSQKNTISMIYANGIFKDLIFKDNYAKQRSKNLLLGFVNITILNTLFQSKQLSSSIALQNDETIGSFIFLIFDVIMDIDNCQFKNGASKFGGSMYISGDSIIRITNSQFTNNNAYSKGGAIYSSGFKSIYIGEGTLFNNNSALDSGEDIYITNSINILTLDNVILSNLNSKNSIYIEQAVLHAQNLIIKDINQNKLSKRGAGLFCNFCNGLLIKTSQFINLKSTEGGAIYITEIDLNKGITQEQKNEKFVIQNSQFHNCTSEIGGAINADNPQSLKIINSTFINNKAKVDQDSQFQIKNKGSGGAIYYTCNAQLLNSKDDYFIRQLQEVNTSSNDIESQRSGGVIPTIYMALKDQYGQIVGSDFSSKGTLSFDIIGGIAVIQQISIVGNPGSSYKLLVTTDGIDLTKKSNKDKMNEKGTQNLDFDLKVELRECEIGEQFTAVGKCLKCEKSFSLVKMTSPGFCENCPTGKAICNGGAEIGPQPGFWRKDNQSKVFVQCLFEQACLGMIPPKNNPLGECLQGYQGILCADCISGYSRDNDYQCALCPETALNTLRLITIFIACVILVVLMIRSTLRGAQDINNVTSIYLKILLNHFQLILMTASFDFQWSQQIVSFFTTTKQVATQSTQIFSFDCFLDTGGESKGSQMSRIFFQKLVIIALLPFLLAIICSLIWNIYKKIMKNQVQIGGKIMSSLVILLFLVHPSLVTYSFNDFKCKDIDSQYRVQDDLEIICWSPEHTFYSYFVALPCIIVWGLGIPFFALAILMRKRKKLDSFEIRQRFGFLYRGYRKDYYYWEIVIMYRKILIIFTAVFISNFGIVAQALIVFFILIIFLMINFKKQPFNTLILNDLETLSLITSMITIYCGLFFILNKPKEWIEENPDYARGSVSLSTGFQRLFFALILVSNLLFFTYWSLRMYEEGKAKFREKFTKIYLALFLCFNQTKLEAEFIAYDIEQQNINYYQQLNRQLKLIKKRFRNGDLKLNKNNIERLLINLSLEQIEKLVKPRQNEIIDADHFQREQKRLLHRKYSSKIEQTKHSFLGQANDKSSKKFSALEQQMEQNGIDPFEDISQYYRDDDSRIQTMQTEDSQLDLNFEINSQDAKVRRQNLKYSQLGVSINFQNKKDFQLEKGFRYNRFKKDKISQLQKAKQNISISQTNLNNDVNPSAQDNQEQNKKSLTKLENKIQNNQLLSIKRDGPSMPYQTSLIDQQNRKAQFSPLIMKNQQALQFESSNQIQLEFLQENLSSNDQNSGIYEEIAEEELFQQAEEFLKIQNEYNQKKKQEYIQISKKYKKNNKVGVKKEKSSMINDSKVINTVIQISQNKDLLENLRTTRQMQKKAQSEYKEQQLNIEFIDDDGSSENHSTNSQNLRQDKLQTDYKEQEVKDVSSSGVDQIDYEQEEVVYDDENLIIFSNREDQIQQHQTKAFRPTKSFIIKHSKHKPQIQLTEIASSNIEDITQKEQITIQDQKNSQADLDEMVLELIDYTSSSEQAFDNNKKMDQSKNLSSIDNNNNSNDSQKLLSSQK